MRHTDIAIAGGGLAGSTAAAMLGRAGIDAILIDSHQVYPFDFRCEKLDASQVALVRKTGLADVILRAGTLDGEVWIARFGRLLEKRPNQQYGILYDALVNTIRAAIPQTTPFIHGKVAAISTSADRQSLTLASGEEISARLIVLANGLNIGLRHTLGMTPRGGEHLPLDQRRLRRAAARPRQLRVPLADLLSRAGQPTGWPI